MFMDGKDLGSTRTDKILFYKINYIGIILERLNSIQICQQLK